VERRKKHAKDDENEEPKRSLLDRITGRD